LYRAKAIRSEGPKELGAKRIRTADLNLQKRDSIAHAEGLLKGMEVHRSLPLFEGMAGHCLVGSGQLLMHHFLYTFIHIDIATILFLFSILLNSFILNHEFCFYFLNLSQIPLGREEVSK